MIDYSTDELLFIANNVTGEYSGKEIRQAKKELKKRGVSDKLVTDIEEEEETFMKRLDAAARAEQARQDKRNEKNRQVGYQWWELAVILFFAPFYVVRASKLAAVTIILLPCHILSWTPIDTGDYFAELRRLKKEKYDLKFKQRLSLLIIGDIGWLIYGFCQIYS